MQGSRIYKRKWVLRVVVMGGEELRLLEMKKPSPPRDLPGTSPRPPRDRSGTSPGPPRDRSGTPSGALWNFFSTPSVHMQTVHTREHIRKQAVYWSLHIQDRTLSVNACSHYVHKSCTDAGHTCIHDIWC